MPDNLLDKIKKTLEEGYDNVRDSATIVLDKAEDFGKVSKLKFEMKQISVQVEKKLTVLGDAVFPFLEKAKIEKLKDNPAIISIVKDIKNLNKEIDKKQKEIDRLISENEEMLKMKEQDRLQKKIKDLENEIEDRIETLKKLKEKK